MKIKIINLKRKKIEILNILIFIYVIYFKMSQISYIDIINMIKTNAAEKSINIKDIIHKLENSTITNEKDILTVVSEIGINSDILNKIETLTYEQLYKYSIDAIILAFQCGKIKSETSEIFVQLFDNISKDANNIMKKYLKQTSSFKYNHKKCFKKLLKIFEEKNPRIADIKDELITNYYSQAIMVNIFSSLQTRAGTRFDPCELFLSIYKNIKVIEQDSLVD